MGGQIFKTFFKDVRLSYIGAIADIQTGWELCEILSGYFPVIYDPSNPDYNTIGGTGGADKVTLTEAQMPIHNHNVKTNSAGSHHHTGNTSTNGAHTHTGSTNNAGSHKHTGSKYSGGSHSHSLNMGDAGAHTHTLNTNSAGNHNHSFNTTTNGSHTHSVTTQNKGGNAAHKNRPKYKVVALIKYVG